MYYCLKLVFTVYYCSLLYTSLNLCLLCLGTLQTSSAFFRKCHNYGIYYARVVLINTQKTYLMNHKIDFNCYIKNWAYRSSSCNWNHKVMRHCCWIYRPRCFNIENETMRCTDLCINMYFKYTEQPLQEIIY